MMVMNGKNNVLNLSKRFMVKSGILVLLMISFNSCKSETEDQPEKTEIREDYEETEGRNYRAYYGSNNQLKIEGQYDGKGNRHGVWTYYTDRGTKLSVTEYKNGLKDGFIVVYHPNGS